MPGAQSEDAFTVAGGAIETESNRYVSYLLQGLVGVRYQDAHWFVEADVLRTYTRYARPAIALSAGATF